MPPRQPLLTSRTAPLLVAALFLPLLGACASPGATSPHRRAGTAREPLNSERIEQRFGSYGVEVLESDAGTRVSNLYSRDGEHRVCRTLAVVLFPPVIDPRVAAEHQAILGGGSIGAVFAGAGWAIVKRQLLVGELPAPGPDDRLVGLMALTAQVPLAVHVYAFDVARGAVEIPYATIAEVYHPDYLRLGDLRTLYGRAAPSTAGDDPSLVALLTRVRQAIRGH